ncbi:MAG: right-handed parallel beta-helix repeat-containing protein, partial [Flavobacteriales bacterium]|nr:right-handed parallel beta-helix repeat-containing protein [Flavobacteriales bacterium]
NNTLLGSSGSYKLRLNGASGTPALGNVVRNNELTNGYSYQIYMNYQQDALVQGNEISRATASTTTTYYALYMANCTNTVFDGNSVHDVASSTFYGMYVLGDATVGQENIFQNNVIYNVNNGTGSIYATYVSGADYVKFLHNTIIADDQTSSSGLVYGLYSTSTTVTGLEMKNNIVYISRAGSGTKRCLYVAGSSSSFTSDHNVLTMASTDGSTNEVAYFSTGYTTLADWQASNGNAYDQNSLDDDPLFYGPLNPTPSAAAVQDAGDPLVVVPFDFYGTARPQGAGPDPGAIEFELPDCPFPFGVSLAAGTDEISVSWTSGAGNTSYTIEYGLDGFTQGSGTFLTDLLPAAMPVNITGLAQGTPYDVYLYESCTGGDSPTFGPYSITTAIPVLVVGSYCQDFDSWDLCNSPTTGCGQNCPLPDQWKNISGDDSDWSVEAGATTSTTTGPAVDNTLGTTAGQYLYTESSTCYGATRILQSPVFDLSNFTNDPRVSFAYHMYGADMGTLTIQYEEPFGSGNWVNVWSRTGQQQTSASAPWELDTVGLAVTGNFTRIRVVGVTGSNFNSDMAVDDICILEGPCQYPVMSLLSVDCNSVDTTYSVEVDVVDLGSALSVDIDSTTTNGTGTNVAGITATGPVVTGPFGNLNDVTLTIKDPAILGCEFSINVIGPDCTPPPANDTCAYVDPSLTVIGVGSNVTRNGTTTGATDDQNLIQSGYFGSQYEGYVWESFTTTECLDLVIDLCGTSPVYGIGQTGLFAGCGGPILIRTASDFGLCDGNYTAFWNSLPAGTYYYPILHDAEGSNTGPYTWRVRGFAPVTACATNTTVCAATPMTCNSQVTGSTTFLPSTLPANACPFIDVPSSGGSLWYSFTPTVDQNVILSTCAVGTTFDTRLSVFTGPDCNTLDCYTLGDDVGGACGLGTQIEFFAQNGQTYWIAVHSPGPSSHGNFELSLACNTVCPRPPNDVCSTAEGVTSFLLDGTGTFTTGDNSCAMNDAMTTCVPYLNNQGMWYSFNSGDNTIHFLDLHTNNEDGALTSTTMNYVLYSGGCDGDLQAVGEEACVVDGSGDDILLPSLTPSTNYLLRLSNVGDVGIEGTFSLRVQHPGLYDAGITAVNAPSAGLLCTSTISAEVELTNFGETTLTSVDILYDMSGLNPQVYTWTGSLAFGASEIVVLPDFVSPYGIQTFNVATSNPNGQVDQIPGNDALAVPGVDVTGETVVLEITSDNDPSGLFWEIYDQSFNLLAFSDGTGAPNGPAGGYLPNATQSVTLCLSTINGPNFVFLLSDFLGDGLSGTGNGDGSWRLIAENGGTLIGSDFDGTIDGFSVPTFAPQTPSVYTFGQPFNLPPGPAFIEPDECDVFTNSLLNKVYCHAVSGISSYQFEFSRPDAGFVRRIAVPRNWVRFSEMQTSPLLPGLKYFARVRVDDGSGFPNNNWSTGCEMGLDPNQVPGCTGLYDQPGAPAHSCDVIKTFGGSDKIFATPVVTATQYRFRFEGVTAGTVPLRTIARPSYACLLNWFTLPLTDGVYNV